MAAALKLINKFNKKNIRIFLHQKNITLFALLFSANCSYAALSIGPLQIGRTEINISPIESIVFNEELTFEILSKNTILHGSVETSTGSAQILAFKLQAIPTHSQQENDYIDYRPAGLKQAPTESIYIPLPQIDNTFDFGNLSESPDSSSFSGLFKLKISGMRLPQGQDIKIIFNVSSIPEPSTLLFFGIGLPLIYFAKSKRKEILSSKSA